MPHTIQRFEFNRSLTCILARHSVNLNRLSLSIAGPLVCFSGRLEPYHSGAFETKDIRALLRDLESLPYRLRLLFQLDNLQMEKHGSAWSITPLDADTPSEDFGDSFIASAMKHARSNRAAALDEDF